MTDSMSQIPERKTVVKALTAGLLLLLAGAGTFFVLAPYQASRIWADLADWFYARGEDPLVLATAGEGGAYHMLGTQLGLHLDVSRSYRLDVRPTRGSLDNLAMLKSKEADLALIQGGLAAERSTAASDWTGLGLVPERERLVALANLGRQYVHVVVPADSAIRDFRDIAGRRLGVGPSGGGSEALAQDLMKFFRFGEGAALVSDHNPDLAAAFLNGDIDAAFTVYGLFAPALEQLLATGWYRLIPLEEAAAVSRYLPGTFAETLPPYLYGPDRSMPAAEDGPFHTLAVNTLLVCQSDLPDRQVYAILEEIFSGPFLKMARLTDLDEEGAQAAIHLPLHRAAEAFYKRRDPISSDRFEILSFFLAGLVCLASVLHYLVGRQRLALQNHRRDAIRPYFEAMMDYGDAVESANSPSKLTCLIHKIMATQRGAERQWLEGEFDTEDMENLYAVYSLRCNNAFNKIFDLHFQAMRGIGTVEKNGAAASEGAFWRAGDVDRDEPEWPARPELPRPWAPAFEERAAAPARNRTPMADDDFFAGAPLAGIDQTKQEIAATLPARFDSGLLYDTEASGAGSVRIRTSKPAAELQATVNRDVPEGPTPTPSAPEREPEAEFELVEDAPVDERPEQMTLF